MWVQFALLMTSMLVSMLVRSSGTKPTKATLDDFDLPVPDEGTPQYVVFGDVWLDDWVVLSFGDLTTKKVKTSSGK